MKINSINEERKYEEKYQYKNKIQNTGDQDKDGNEKAARRGDQQKTSLYSADQPGARLETRAQVPGMFFENLTWLNANEAAEYLRLPSVGMLRVLVCERRVPFHKLGRRLRFKRVDLDRFLETSRTGGI